MKYKILFLFVFIASCTPQSTYLSTSKSYNAKGLAYIYNDYDYSVKIIKGKMDNKILQLSHQNLRTGALIKIINPQNKESIVLKNERRIKYPDFYKILIKIRVLCSLYHYLIKVLKYGTRVYNIIYTSI